MIPQKVIYQLNNLNNLFTNLKAKYHRFSYAFEMDNVKYNILHAILISFPDVTIALHLEVELSLSHFRYAYHQVFRSFTILWLLIITENSCEWYGFNEWYNSLL